MIKFLLSRISATAMRPTASTVASMIGSERVGPWAADVAPTTGGSTAQPTAETIRGGASPQQTIIGACKPTVPHLAHRPMATVVPIIGTKHGRGHAHAAAFAAEFLAWLSEQPEATTMLPDEVVIDIAANQFAPAAGMPMPPPRNLLSALKRSHGVRVKPNVRVRDARGDVIGKTTMYMLISELPVPPPRMAA